MLISKMEIYRASLDRMIQEQQLAPTLVAFTSEMVRSAIDANLAYGSGWSTLLKLYLELPLRDDAQLLLVHLPSVCTVFDYGDDSKEEENRIHIITALNRPEYKGVNLYLHGSVANSYIYLQKTKTIPRLYSPLLVRVSAVLAKEITKYIDGGQGLKTKDFDPRYLWGKAKLGPSIIRVGRDVLKLEGLSINVLRKLFETSRTETGDYKAMAEGSLLCGHSSSTALKYQALLNEKD